MAAYLAILRYDAEALRDHRLLRAWLLLLALPALFLVLVAATQDELASETLAAYLGWVLLPLSLAAIAHIAGGAVNTEASIVADTMLSRAVTREAYLAAKATARLGAVLIAYALTAVPAALLIARYSVADTSTAGLLVGLAAVAALLWLLASTALALSITIERLPLAILAFLAATALFAATSQAIGLAWLSPLDLIGGLAATLRGDGSLATTGVTTALYATLGGLLLLATFWRYRARPL